MRVCPTDAHCHAEFSAAAANGVRLCADACFCGKWEALRKFDAFPVEKAFGIHPDLEGSGLSAQSCNFHADLERRLRELEGLARSAAAVGEAGLDVSLKDRVAMDIQKNVFQAQLEIADKFGKPVIVHCVGAFGKTLEMLEIWRAKDAAKKVGKNFMLHAARCSKEMVERFAKLGGYFSFGLRELSCKRGQEAACCAPADRLLVESDSAPSEQIVLETLSKLGELRGVREPEILRTVCENYARFFGLEIV